MKYFYRTFFFFFFFGLYQVVSARYVSVDHLANHPAYNSLNPYTKASFYGQCTWYAWGRMYEKMGVMLPSRMGNAKDWLNNISDEFKSSVLTANSIMVVGGNNTLGHVLFIEEIDENYAYISEGNADGSGTIRGYRESRVPLSSLRVGNLYSKSGKILGFIMPYPRKDYYVSDGTLQNLGEEFIGKIIPKYYPSYAIGSYGDINSLIKLEQNMDGDKAIKWKFTRNKDGSYSILNLLSQMYLSVNYSRILQIGENTRWFIFDYNGGYRLVAASFLKQSYAMDIVDGRAFEGQKLQIFEALNEKNAAQTFQVEILNEQILYQTKSDAWSWPINKGISGTVGQGKALTHFKIMMENQLHAGDIMYRAYIEHSGWELSWKKNGEILGVDHHKIEAIQIKLTGNLNDYYDLYYRVHVQNFGWMGWTKNGASAGSVGFGYRVEAIEFLLVRKTDEVFLNFTNPFKNKNETQVCYQTHIQNIGWQGEQCDGVFSGTVGKALRLEAINISLKKQRYSGFVEYMSYVEKRGWENVWRRNKVSGTTGLGLQLEAIKIRLVGEIAKFYDIYYRVHVQNFGWMGWTKNGGYSGTLGYLYRIEAIEMKLVNKEEYFSPQDSLKSYYIK